jgi:thymidylate kinase
MTTLARELISQAIRSIHIEKVIIPAMSQYDFIIQDRGILSGLAYGEVCGNSINWLIDLADKVVSEAYPQISSSTFLYNKVILLTGNVKLGLDKALSSKQEFDAGDAIEMKGISFMEQVNTKMIKYSTLFNTTSVCVDGKDIEAVFNDILKVLYLEELK